MKLIHVLTLLSKFTAFLWVILCCWLHFCCCYGLHFDRKRGGKKHFWQKSNPKLTADHAGITLALDSTLQSYSWLLFRAAITCTYKESFQGEEQKYAQPPTFVAIFFFFSVDRTAAFEFWITIEWDVKSEFLQRGSLSSDAASESCSAWRLRSQVLLGENQLHILCTRGAVHGRSRIRTCCSEVTGLSTPTLDQCVSRIYHLNFFPSWCTKNEI